MIKNSLFLLLLICASVRLSADIIDPGRIIDWSTAGVAGGIPTRNTISQTVSATTYGNDSTNATTAIQTAMNATAAGQVCYIPPGIYSVNNTLTFPNNITVRGAGKFTLSSSSVAVGTGTKTFTVAASLGYSAGVQVRVVRANFDGNAWSFDQGTYMQGSVTSYSGTTLTLNVTASADGGGSGTYSRWMVSLTVIKQTGSTSAIFALGTNGAGMQFYPTSYSKTISSGASRGSVSFVVSDATGIDPGDMLVVTERNQGNSEANLTGKANTPYVANWVDGWATYISGTTTSGSAVITTGDTSGIATGMMLQGPGVPAGATVSSFVANTSVTMSANANLSASSSIVIGGRCKGQTIQVTGVAGTTINFAPALYSDYTSTPWATQYYAAGCSGSGLEDLMLYATNSGTTQNVLFDSAINCWMDDCYSNFCDGDHVELDWSFQCTVSNNFFEDAFIHTSGSSDNQVGIRKKTSKCLIVNNIMKRMHISFVAEWGAAGNVIAYNYMFGEYDQAEGGGNRALQMSLNANHGAFPQFNLYEGNWTQHFIADSFWGSGGNSLLFRSVATGVGTSYSPYNSRGTPGTPYTLNQGRYAYDIYEGQYRMSAIGCIFGVTASSAAGIYTVTEPASRTYGNQTYMRSFGYGSSSGSGSDSILPNPSLTSYYHGNYDYVNQSIQWDAGNADHSIPNSMFLSAKPAEFGNLSWPAYDPASPSTNPALIPAGYRYLNGVNPESTSTTIKIRSNRFPLKSIIFTVP